MKTRIENHEIPKHLFDGMYLNESYLKKSEIPPTLIALVKTRASQINGCGYCLDMHHKDALHAGEKFERLYLLPAWEESPCFSPEEKAVLHLTNILTDIAKHSPEVIDEAYRRVEEFYDKEFIAQLVLLICQINSWNRIAITFGLIPGSYQVTKRNIQEAADVSL